MITYRLATEEDNGQLIKLTAASGMAGETSLRIDRKPDFFKLLKMRGESKVWVALDDSTVIGSICVSKQQVYVGGEMMPFEYIGDLKVAEEYRNKGIGLHLCNELADHLISIDADLAFLNVSKGNTKPASFFKNRPHIPDFINIGVFNVHQFIGKKSKVRHPEFKIESTLVSDEVITFLNIHYRSYQPGYVITKEKLKDTNIFIVQHEKKIIAAMCLVDTMNVKQNVVTKLSFKMKYLVMFMNFYNSIAGNSKMPSINEPVRMMYIKYLAVNNNEKHLGKSLVNYARNIVYERSYSFVSLGLHEKDPLNTCLSGLLKITVQSEGMLISIKDTKTLIEKIKHGVPFVDYSLV